MTDNVLRTPYILFDLKKSPSTQDTIATLMTLNEIITKNDKEIEILYDIGGFHLLIQLMTNDELANVCLRIFATACKKDEKLRKKLLATNIFYLLSDQLKNLTDFSNRNLVLYAALLVILVQGNQEAQNLMKVSGCLSNVTKILNSILAEGSRVPCRNAELVVYVLIACIKDPRNSDNQTEVGWIIPKILEHVSNQTIFVDGDHLELIKSFWSFLRCVLDGNKDNQRIFFKSSGFTVLFRSMQDVLDEGKIDVMGDVLTKMTGLLVKLKSHKEFLCLASGFCPVTILCSLLRTTNLMVLENIIDFLDSLTHEFPQALKIIKERTILRGMLKAKLLLSRSTATEGLYRDIWTRAGILPGAIQEELTVMGNLNPFNQNANHEIDQICALHYTDIKVRPDDRRLRRIRFSGLHRFEARRWGRLRKTLNLLNVFHGGLVRIYQKFLSLFRGKPGNFNFNRNVQAHEYFV